jgi:hypothetical protein
MHRKPFIYVVVTLAVTSVFAIWFTGWPALPDTVPRPTPVAAPPAASSGCATAQDFWTGFRAAIAQNNAVSVARLAQFPFEVRSALNENESRRVSEAQFVELFPKLLNTDSGMTAIPTTMQVYLTSTPVLSPAACSANENQFRIGAWLFELKPDGWRFVRAYVDD